MAAAEAMAAAAAAAAAAAKTAAAVASQDLGRRALVGSASGRAPARRRQCSKRSQRTADSRHCSTSATVDKNHRRRRACILSS